MSLRTILGLTILLITVVSSAQDLAPHDQTITSKAAWQLTDDERINARLDPEKIRERAAYHSARTSRLHTGVSSSLAIGSGQPLNFRIDGDENPELFLPFELFTDLLRGVDMSLPSTDREVMRAILAPRIRAFGYEADAFWASLGSSVAGYFDVRDGARSTQANRKAHMQATQAPAGESDISIRLCRERFAALNSAREHFGRETFDRFLYTAVAPTLTVTSNAPGAQEASGLRYLAGGCQ